jgi:hypothetical protein
MRTHTPTYRRLASGMLGLALAAGLGASVGLAVDLSATPTAAHAASVKGGSITRAEVIERAEYWLDRAGSISYNQSGSYPDPQGDNYRTDCSGYIAMALHMSTQPSTGGFASHPDVIAISRSELKPGDFLITSGHGILFGGWESASTFSYYAFGSTPVDFNPGHSFSDATLDGHATSGYQAYRYTKIIDSPRIADFDGDGKTDQAVLRPSTNTWNIMKSGSGGSATTWGQSGDVLTPGDYDGDGKTDVAIWRPSTGNWSIIRSGNGTNYVVTWGQSGDVATPGDYDGDGKTDVAIWRPSTGNWSIIRSGNGTNYVVNYGLSTDVPVFGGVSTN